MGRFSLKPSGLVGISIQPQNIHLIQLKKAKKSYFLERAKQVALPENVFAEGKVREFATLAAILTELVHAEKLQSAQAAVCVMANQVKMQRMIIPVALSDADVTAEIAAEVYRSLPGKSDALAIDFERRQGGALETEVYFAAARSDYVAQYVKCLRDADLVPAVVEVDVFALLRAARHALQYVVGTHEKIAALYFGQDYAVIVAQHDAEIIFFQQWDGQNTSGLAMTFLQWVEWCCQTYRHHGIANVALGGKRDGVSQAGEIIRAHWPCKIFETDPFAQMPGVINFEKSNLASERSAFLLACGLAMRESLPWLK